MWPVRDIKNPEPEPFEFSRKDVCPKAFAPRHIAKMTPKGLVLKALPITDALAIRVLRRMISVLRISKKTLLSLDAVIEVYFLRLTRALIGI